MEPKEISETGLSGLGMLLLPIQLDVVLVSVEVFEDPLGSPTPFVQGRHQ
jgi:hypothetical protein